MEAAQRPLAVRGLCSGCRRRNRVGTAREGALHCAQLLLLRHAEVDQGDLKGSTPLMHAARAEHCQTVVLLLDWGAEPSAADKTGNTANIDWQQLALCQRTRARDRIAVVTLVLAEHITHTYLADLVLSFESDPGPPARSWPGRGRAPLLAKARATKHQLRSPVVVRASRWSWSFVCCIWRQKTEA